MHCVGTREEAGSVCVEQRVQDGVGSARLGPQVSVHTAHLGHISRVFSEGQGVGASYGELEGNGLRGLGLLLFPPLQPPSVPPLLGSTLWLNFLCSWETMLLPHALPLVIVIKPVSTHVTVERRGSPTEDNWVSPIVRAAGWLRASLGPPLPPGPSVPAPVSTNPKAARLPCHRVQNQPAQL